MLSQEIGAYQKDLEAQVWEADAKDLTWSTEAESFKSSLENCFNFQKSLRSLYQIPQFSEVNHVSSLHLTTT